MNTLSHRDIEVLSAYLDDQLSPRQRDQVEKRLKIDNNLRTTLEELRQTRALLRNLPKVRAPRNFTLTSEMVGIPLRPSRPTRGLFPVMRWASVIATILLAIVFTGDVFFSGMRLLFSGTQAYAPEPMVSANEAPELYIIPEAEVEVVEDHAESEEAEAPAESVSPTEEGAAVAVEEETVEEEIMAAEAEEEIMAAEVEEGMAEEEPPSPEDAMGAGEAAEAEADQAEEQEAPLVEEAEMEVEESPSEEEAMRSTSPTPTLAGTPAPPPTPLQEQAEKEAQPTDTIIPQPTRTTAPATGEMQGAAPEPVVPGFSVAMRPLRILEGILALLALGFGLTAFLLKRQGR